MPSALFHPISHVHAYLFSSQKCKCLVNINLKGRLHAFTLFHPISHVHAYLFSSQKCKCLVNIQRVIF